MSCSSHSTALKSLDLSKTGSFVFNFPQIFVSLLCLHRVLFMCHICLSFPSDPFSVFPCSGLNSRGLIAQNYIFSWVQPMGDNSGRYMQERKKNARVFLSHSALGTVSRGGCVSFMVPASPELYTCVSSSPHVSFAGSRILITPLPPSLSSHL